MSLTPKRDERRRRFEGKAPSTTPPPPEAPPAPKRLGKIPSKTKAVSQATLVEIMGDIGADLAKRFRAVEKAHAAEVGTLTKRIDLLEAECNQLRSQRMKYCGIYEHGTTYREGDVLTHRGSLWHCDHDTQTEPNGGGAWTLCVRRGRDGKHAHTLADRGQP